MGMEIFLFQTMIDSICSETYIYLQKKFGENDEKHSENMI